MARQMSFHLPGRTALGREDFFVSPANAAAVAMIEGWQGWPARKLMLAGPQGAGKTHLAHVWAGLSGAAIVPAEALARADIPALAAAHVAVEDCDRIAGEPAAEAALFHLHNLALAEGRALLFTGRTGPAHWPLALPDLASRLQATPSVHIAPPDDALLAAVMMKLFADRQLAPSAATIPFLLRRIDRSFAAARDIVDRLDAAALERRQPITQALARRVLDKDAP